MFARLTSSCCLGNVEKDFQFGLDLLQSPKDHVEFTIVREWLKVALEQVCTDVNVEVPKSLLRQAAVQHLYSKLSGTLADEKNDADILVSIFFGWMWIVVLDALACRLEVFFFPCTKTAEDDMVQSCISSDWVLVYWTGSPPSYACCLWLLQRASLSILAEERAL